MIAVTPVEFSYSDDIRNFPSAYVELDGPDGPLGTWLVSTLIGNPQTFTYADRTWKLFLRPRRSYEPYSVTLEKFSHDLYPGTDIAKNFSSKVRINSPDGGSREVLIYMNNPLRYSGLTYYQASFDNNDHTSILEVVRNPSWLVPYISCAAIALGLVIQFLIHLVEFGRKRRP
ncbi:MAG TPA: cytochrome c biogenesis protein ResB, partial [Opitutaceae bacterium]